MRRRLIDLARVIRSKNAGPFELTLDIICKDQRQYDMLKGLNIFTEEMVSGLYGIPIEDVLAIIYFEPAKAIKITLKRRIASGAFGETDIYGAQQHAPLMNMEFDDHA